MMAGRGIPCAPNCDVTKAARRGRTCPTHAVADGTEFNAKTPRCNTTERQRQERGPPSPRVPWEFRLQPVSAEQAKAWTRTRGQGCRRSGSCDLASWPLGVNRRFRIESDFHGVTSTLNRPARTAQRAVHTGELADKAVRAPLSNWGFMLKCFRAGARGRSAACCWSWAPGIR